MLITYFKTYVISKTRQQYGHIELAKGNELAISCTNVQSDGGEECNIDVNDFLRRRFHLMALNEQDIASSHIYNLLAFSFYC